jgi:hypothetical protein
MNYANQLVQLNKKIIACKKLKFQDLTLLPAMEEDKKYVQAQASALHPSLTDFYTQVKSYSLKWESKVKLPQKIYGSVKLLPPQKALTDWKEIVYFEDDSPLRFFRILDHFVNEACCGFFTTDSKNYVHHVIYYYDFHDQPQSLQLTIEGYMTMMEEAKGFLYWQRVLLDHLKRTQSPHTLQMRENLNQVFTDFTFDSFLSAYQKVKV